VLLGDADRAALENAVRSRGRPSDVWLVENVDHLMALSTDAAAYQARLGDFLSSLAPTIAPSVVAPQPLHD
jgi:hypothetical protein